MLPGVYEAKKKDGSLYYRSSLTYRSKHISLGSFSSEMDAHTAYVEAMAIIDKPSFTLQEVFDFPGTLSFDKAITIINFRDNKVYLKNPIYMYHGYFVYYLNPNEELKFDIDELFYYSDHKIIKRGGHLYVNEYGNQINLRERYGIRNYAVLNRDYRFRNGDTSDYRYGNIEILNEYYGVTEVRKNGITMYRTKLHLNGNITIGTYPTAEMAAIAYNKALDLLKSAGIKRNFPENYVEINPRKYAELYTEIKVARGFKRYLFENAADL